MRVVLFGAKAYEKPVFDAANRAGGHEIVYQDAHLTVDTAAIADGAGAVCVFVNDSVDAGVIERLAQGGVRLIALRSAGFNHVDLAAAARAGIAVARVPAYSPHAVAEHTVALMMTLNRRIHKAYNRVREGNFALDGLIGFDLAGKTVGLIGTGKIGTVTARILNGFDCRLLACDLIPSPGALANGVHYRPLDEVLSQSDVVSLHCPLTPDTRHMIDARAIGLMKPGAMLINTSRGGLVDTRALIDALKSGHLGALGLDVYEEEADLFFENLSDHVLRDDVFARLLTFPNVLITGHQAFFTHEAMTAIAETTMANVTAFERSGAPVHAVTADIMV